MVLGALAVCVVALAAYVLTTNTVKDRQAQLEAVTAQADATREAVNQLKPYADFQAMAETRIQTVKDLASSRFDWEQALRDISRAVPAEVTLQELNGTISSDAGGGGLRGAIAAPAIELKGCSSGQTQVATLLSRLRNVDGVTRVSLNKSIKPEKSKTIGGGPSPIAGLADAAGCKGKRPPSFEIVMFFEGAEVPATVEDITVQPSAGNGAEGTTTSTETEGQAGGVTTPPSVPEGDDTATPASTPEGGAAQ